MRSKPVQTLKNRWKKRLRRPHEKIKECFSQIHLPSKIYPNFVVLSPLRRFPGSGGLWGAPGRLQGAPGGSKELPGGSCEGPWRLPVAMGASRRLPRGSGGPKVRKTLVFQWFPRGPGAEGRPGMEGKKHRSGPTKQVDR